MVVVGLLVSLLLCLYVYVSWWFVACVTGLLVCLVMMLYFVGGLMSMGCFCEFVLLVWFVTFCVCTW